MTIVRSAVKNGMDTVKDAIGSEESLNILYALAMIVFNTNTH